MTALRILIGLALAWVAPVAFACGPDTDCPLGDRHYRIAMPEGHDGVTPVGAIVFAHGYRGSARGVMRNTGLRRMVSDMGLALIAVKSGDEDWVIPNAPRHPDTDGAVEFDYFEAVMGDASLRFALDRTRVMMTGFSAGGMMVWNLACARPDLFAGFAPIAGTFWLDEDFLMRARVRGFDLAWRWPALENLSGRKPRGLGGIYGERALWAGFEAAADSLFFRSKVAVSAFCKRGCPRIGLGRCRFARFTRRPGSLRTRDFGRCG